MSQPVIRVEDLGKLYRLGEVGTGTISHDLNRWWARVRGKEDPFAKVGQTNDRTRKGDSDYVWALKDVNFEVQPGEVLGIIGRNGAGKSTLLKILSKVTTPSTGRIRVKGRIASLLEVGTGFHPELTGRENIFLNGAILGMTKAEIRSKFDAIVDFAGVERYIDTPVKRYSSGMYVRLAFAVAAFLEPEILIVDEVLAVGDAEFQKKCLGRMKDVSVNEGRTVLFVSHNMAAVKNLCHHGLLLRNGTVEKWGGIEEVIESYLNQNDFFNTQKLDAISKREGNGSLRFTDLQLLDAKGQQRDRFFVGESLVIKLEFLASESFFNAPASRIDVGINDVHGHRVAWVSTAVYADKIEAANGFVCFHLDKLLLKQGSYTFNLYSETNVGAADWLQQVGKMEIEFGDFYQTGRIIPPKQGVLVPEFTIA